MRKIFAKIHIWLSIPFGFIIAIVCLTGSILVFEMEILQLCYPSRYFVKEVKGEPLSPATLIASARGQLPDSLRINGIRVFSDPKRTYQLVLPGKKAAAFIDPYTGELTGIDDGKGFFMQTMRLHRWLLDEYKRDGGFSWGKTIVGYATLVLALITISGIFIWLPRNRKVLKNRLKIKTGAGWRRFFYDLHVSGGFYAALLLLVMSLTGLTWSFGWYRTTFYTVFGVNVTPAHAHVKEPDGKKAREAKGGQKNSPEQTGVTSREERLREHGDYTLWVDVLSDLRSRYTDFNSITLQEGVATVSAANYGNMRGSDRYAFNRDSGKITEVLLYKDLPDSGKIKGWIYSVHVGSWGGMITRLLNCLVSFLGAVFVISGYYFWIKKKIGALKR